ncbi:helix-turn-helix domain-containing protein [Ralstonia thomasii]|jgi:Helix-turn-helix domain
MTSSNDKARGGAGFPIPPVIRGSESTASIQIKMQAYLNRLRLFWQSCGIPVESTDGEAQIARLAAILRLHRGRGLGSLEGRAAGAMVQLPARIFDLKARGWDILTLREPAWGADGLRHPNTARYVLLKEPEAANV